MAKRDLSDVPIHSQGRVRETSGNIWLLVDFGDGRLTTVEWVLGKPVVGDIVQLDAEGQVRAIIPI